MAVVVITECSDCSVKVKVNTETGAVTTYVPSNGKRGRAYVAPHTVTEYAVFDGDLFLWDCGACGYADSTYADEDVRAALT